uniref:Dynactin subunit 6 n=1 Tax=Halisarca dujardinii TaxID=2583056 RepID=A0A9F1U3Z3_HALDU|nr:dynactin 6 [Halisarca dujardinii]
MASNPQRRITLGPDGVVCKEAELSGDITFGSRCIVHPGARIVAEGGPIVMGDGNLIKEGATIINKKREDSQQPVLIIGNGNVFDIKSYCSASIVGNNNTFEPCCRVNEYVTVTEDCVIGAGCTLSGREELPRGTVVYGSEHSRCVRPKSSSTQTSQQLTMLAKVLPNYHKLVKS